jgi:hypothetical protein
MGRPKLYESQYQRQKAYEQRRAERLCQECREFRQAYLEVFDKIINWDLRPVEAEKAVKAVERRWRAIMKKLGC